MKRPYSSARRTSAAAETRRAVLAAALALFEERGFVAATLAEIAARAEVAVNTVYTSVGGKPQLLIELVKEASADEEIERAMAEVRAARSGHAVIEALASGTSAVFKNSSWVLGTLYDNAANDPQIADAVADAEARYASRLAEAAAKIASLGDLRADLDSATASNVLWFYFGFRPWRDLLGRGWTWDRAAAWLVAQAEHALLARA
ncbi:TetR/AcrR family transcriptional regulator [Amycolatopsis sp. NPDC004169]|uniref:TetR/AcrR family transcriptional regulator n=1 Tax=Amycolatopsis sp. NPDC004169 TaxID=3154453 RepID=UPI0033A973EC